MRDTTQLHPELQQKIVTFLNNCYKNGYKVKITECFRTVAEQDALYAKGRTAPGSIVTNAKGSSYSSQHQWGVAFDICRNDGTGAYNDTDKWFSKVATIGKACGLGWGGDWKSPVDKPHFYLKDWGSTTSTLKSKYTSFDKFKNTWAKCSLQNHGNLTVKETEELLKKNSTTTEKKTTTTTTNKTSTTTSSKPSYKHLIKSLQTALNKEYSAKLVVDGVPGPKTLAATPTLSKATRNKKPKTVEALQDLLIYFGYSCGDAGSDGDFYKKTEAAVKKFQEEKVKLKKPDGIVTAEAKTWKKLLKLS